MWLVRKLKQKVCVRLLCSVILISSFLSLFLGKKTIKTLGFQVKDTIRASVPRFTQTLTETKDMGSRANYSILKVDNFIHTFQSRYNKANSSSKDVLRLKSEESYEIFLRRLNSLKKKGKMLVQNTDKPAKNSAERFFRGVNQFYLYDPNDERVIEDLLRDLNFLPTVSAEILKVGSQMKISLTFSDGSNARFKPMRKPREVETPPDNFYFSDFERHTAEIAGFHLDRVLGFHRAVPTVGRVFNITRDLATVLHNKEFVESVYTSPAGNLCFVAKCVQFCGAYFPYCGHPDVIEGAVSVGLPAREIYPRTQVKYPYARSYSFENKAAWEHDESYCHAQVMGNFTSHQLLEFMDFAVFDFLIGNRDRHAFESFKNLGEENCIPNFDNGRGFGQSNHDCMSCIAPLRQCCLIRLSTLAKLIKLYQGPDSLSQVLRKSLNSDPLSPVLLEPHLDALDRRLGKVIKVVSDCINNGRSWDDVVVDDVVKQ